MDRTEFEKRLRSLVVPEGTSATNLIRMVLPLRDALIDMTPGSLFRYRSCEEKHIDAFEKDKIYAVPADWFNDPYDTLVRYDFDGIKKYVEQIASIDGLEQLKFFYSQGNDFSPEFKQMFPDELWASLRERVLEIDDIRSVKDGIENSKQQLLSLISTCFPILSFFGKRFSTIACFSEDVRSILMWSHYADSHRGFALEYDFRSTLNDPLPRVGLYPVIYSEERYDASAYLTWALLTVMGIKAFNPDISANIKAALYKSNLWEYEKEWRMIDPGPHDILNPAPTFIEYRPKAIYYGQNIEARNKEWLHAIAEEKGIEEFEMMIDCKGEGYGMEVRSLE